MFQTSVPQYHLLVVDDDNEIRQGLKDFFEIKGYRVTTASEGQTALEILRQQKDIDLTLLDVMMPKVNGFDILRNLRALGIDTPVLMLTAKGEQKDVLDGFGLGVDDYVVKPFNADVLALRVKAILSRRLPPSMSPMDIHQVGELEVNFSSHEANRNGESVELTVQEFDLLHYMIENKGRTLSREQILQDVWGLPPDLITRTIDRHIASLRKKVEANPANPQYIETVYGVGYRLREYPMSYADETVSLKSSVSA
jgi:DNA-binding response OmpR family regulator